MWLLTHPVFGIRWAPCRMSAPSKTRCAIWRGRAWTLGGLVGVYQIEISEGAIRTQGKVALAGGGGANDSRLLDEVFAAWIGPHGKLLYWPFALRGIRSFQSCLEWITTTFAPLNVTDITMWNQLPEHQPSELEEFDAVYIGGGNTFNLLAELKESGFERYLRAFVQGGKAVFGGSAGAAVLGRDIRTVNHLDRNDVRLTDTQGLDLADGHAVWLELALWDATNWPTPAKQFYGAAGAIASVRTSGR